MDQISQEYPLDDKDDPFQDYNLNVCQKTNTSNTNFYHVHCNVKKKKKQKEKQSEMEFQKTLLTEA